MTRPLRALVVMLAFASVPALLAGAAGDAGREAREVDVPTLRFGVLSDAQEDGERPGLRAAVRELERLGASALLYAGDTSYGHGGPPETWAGSLASFDKPGRTLFVYGNHDDGDAYARWLPDPEAGTWWSERIGDVLVVGLDTNAPLHVGSPQMRWLEATLAKPADGPVILVMHIAWWPPNAHHAERLAFPGDGAVMDALVAEHGVDLVLAGHEHYYARETRGGVPHVVLGAVEAHVREVPADLAARAEASASVATLTRLDVHACGLAAWTTTPDGEPVDRFAIGVAGPPPTLTGGEAACPG